MSNQSLVLKRSWIYLKMEIKETESIIEKSENYLKCRMFFSEEAEYFKGHFDDFKLLPGLVQLKILTTLIKKHFDSNFNIVKIPNTKFVKPVYPGQEVEVTLNRENESYQFSISKSGKLCAKGILKNAV